ncbi:MAG: Unknown protein [uncultured Sulfurovum sp.]|uniref:Histidine kinase domain-containing protein n=1 Tax=uncultured Sulfurovum sp. TaxID=269237 RepID=A0A6S6T4M4_9BACT|nr:MAG: Unknown protein [uncultured Sulfurovum sp.]
MLPKILITINTNHIIVSDNAGGIHTQNINDIFSQEVTSKNSLGLGLYMSKKIIEESMAGTLNVENGIDGAIFRITL